VKFVADEGVDRQIVDRLRREGHSVWYVAEMAPGISDGLVLDLAKQQEALLLTGDKDFGELMYRRRRLAAGAVLIRLAGIAPDKKAEIVASAINEHAAELPQAFSVITPGRMRIRRRDT